MPDQPTHEPMPLVRDPDATMTSAQTREKLVADIPYGVRVAAGWSWRLIIVIVALGLTVWLLSHVTLLIIPLLAAALLATLLAPLHMRLMRWGFPPMLSVLTTLVALLGLVGFLLYTASRQLALGFADMAGQINSGMNQLMSFATEQGWVSGNWDKIFDDMVSTVKANSDVLVSGAIGFGSTATNLVAGTVMALFALVFFLKDGPRIWSFLLRFLPTRHRRALNGAGEAGWRSLGSYVRIQIFVAFVDAVGIGVGAWILGVPLALPLGVLVFLASFIPIVGAVATGTIAVLLALVTNGLTNALLMLAVVLLVQQLESNVLQPLVMGKAVSLHPLAVFLAVAAGTAVLGLVGAVFAVPVLAFINSFVQYLSDKPWMRALDPHAIDPDLPQLQ